MASGAHRRPPTTVIDTVTLTGCVPIAVVRRVVTVRGVSYPSGLTDEQWELLESVCNAPGKRGRRHAHDLRTVVDAMLYIAQTGCQWRYLPESFGPWSRVWSQFRRWSRNGTWPRAITVLHAAERQAGGRAEATSSMLVIDTHLARGASNGGATFHDQVGPYGRTKGAQPCRGGRCDRAARAGARGPWVTEPAARKRDLRHGVEVRRVGWGRQAVRVPTHPACLASRGRPRPLGRSRRLANSFENTTSSATGWLHVACIATTLRHVSRAQPHQRTLTAAA
jgi:transposase